jgi:nitric oxide synthase oxygenase domain/subunit
VADETAPDRFVHVVTVTGWDGRERNVDLLELVYQDPAERPPAVTRMLGNAEVAAGVTIPDA